MSIILDQGKLIVMELRNVPAGTRIVTTIENDEAFRNLLHINGYKWRNGESYIGSDLSNYAGAKIYNIHKGLYLPRNFLKGINILDASLFLKEFDYKEYLLNEINKL